MKGTIWVISVGIASVLAAAGVSTAEIYRWTDSSGGQHFSMDLHSVPPAYRAEAQASAGTIGRGANLNMISTDDHGGGDPAPRSSGPAAVQPQAISRPESGSDLPEEIGGYSEAGWRARIQTLTDEMSALEKAIDACKDLVAPVRYDYRTGKRTKRQHYDKKMDAIDRCSTSQSSLEFKKRQLESLRENARKNGVPPGWLRTR